MQLAIFAYSDSKNWVLFALAALVLVLLPIIFYNLVQHLLAGCVDRILSRTTADRRP